MRGLSEPEISLRRYPDTYIAFEYGETMIEPPDQNKTALTLRATATAAAYLDGIGCKPVETEVQVAPGWIADLASFWYPSRTEAKKLGLTTKAAEAICDVGCDEADKALTYFGYGPLTVLVEVKTSRQDFCNDRKWSSRSPANISILAYTTAVMPRPDEVPDGWFGLSLSTDGLKLLRIVRTKGRVEPQHFGPMLDFIANVAIRRDHRTRYSAIRALVKAWRTRDRDRQKALRLPSLILDIADWISGVPSDRARTLREVLARHGVKRSSAYLDGAIARLEEVKRLTR